MLVDFNLNLFKNYLKLFKNYFCPISLGEYHIWTHWHKAEVLYWCPCYELCASCFVGDDEGCRSDFQKAADLGSAFAKQQLVALNPYAALCNSMLSQMMSNAVKGEPTNSSGSSAWPSFTSNYVFLRLSLIPGLTLGMLHIPSKNLNRTFDKLLIFTLFIFAFVDKEFILNKDYAFPFPSNNVGVFLWLHSKFTVIEQTVPSRGLLPNTGITLSVFANEWSTILVMGDFNYYCPCMTLNHVFHIISGC